MAIIQSFSRDRSKRGHDAFSLVELMIVTAIMILVSAFLAPAFRSLKSAGDVTNPAYTIKGVLDQAATYARANNTYVWVGFYEENASQSSTNPASAGIGRLVISVVASNDGTIIYDPSSPAKIDTTKLIQLGKLTKIDNVHLWTHTDTPSETGSTFDTRPNVASTYCIGDLSPPSSTTPFQYPVRNPEPAEQYRFVKVVQFSPSGQARIGNNNYSLKGANEIGLRPTQGTAVDTNSPNVVAIQFGGAGGNVTIYRK